MSNKNPIISLDVRWNDMKHAYRVYPKSSVRLILETENSFHITFEDSMTELVINKHCLVMWETKRKQAEEAS